MSWIQFYGGCDVDHMKMYVKNERLNITLCYQQQHKFVWTEFPVDGGLYGEWNV